jgi:hypothetical protein
MERFRNSGRGGGGWGSSAEPGEALGWLIAQTRTDTDGKKNQRMTITDRIGVVRMRKREGIVGRGRGQEKAR